MSLVDSHCHLDADEFDPDRAQVIARAQAAGVRTQLLPAVTAASWPKLRDTCQLAEGLYPAYGLHPMFLDEHRPEHLEQLREWIVREQPCAVGECGLDFFVDGLDAELQKFYFDGQLRIAREFDLPVIVHARRAVDAVIAAIKQVGGLRGVIHSFPGSPEQAAQLHKLGFLVGLGGPLTYDRAQRLQRLVAQLPIEQLLLETDAPDQPDAGIRGERNEPARLTVIAETVAKLRGETVAGIAEQTSANARRLFAIR
ncbi:TatD family hydrolase [Stenotrophomonas sp. NPDC047960]|uniref:TatD family hydrolase n=1 Tax=Stenotrophomonas sp. NPDC047960 TaxID=3364531 RepID=UPI00371DF0C7